MIQDETHLLQQADIYPIGFNSPPIHKILHQNHPQPLHAWFHAATVLFLMEGWIELPLSILVIYYHLLFPHLHLARF